MNKKILYKEKLCACIVTIIYTFSLIYLYYNQTNSEFLGKVLTDLPAHIEAGVSGNSCYSLTYLILGFLWKLPHCRVMVALCLTFFTLLSVFATLKLLKHLLPKVGKANLYLLALICNMYMPLFIPFFNDNDYLGLLSFVLYHNSTYIMMRPLAIFSIFIFLKLREKYTVEKINIKEWIVFALLLLVTTWFKPNFMFGFAPCMLFIMIFDFIKMRGKKIVNYIIFGTAVLPSVFLMLWQQAQLFDNSAGLEFSYFKVWDQYAKHPLMALIQSIAFPIVVLIFNYKDLIKDKIFRFGWFFAFINIFIFIFINEKGSRIWDGNLAWGANFAVGVLFIISMYKFIDTIRRKNLQCVMFSSAVLGMHFLCWINFYLNTLKLFYFKEFIVSFFRLI